MRPFFTYPLTRMGELANSAAFSLRTLSPEQLSAEREALRSECAGAVGANPAVLLLAVYDQEIARRGVNGAPAA